MLEPFEAMEWNCPATLDEIDRVCRETRRFLEAIQASDQDLFAIELMMREALTNAVVHGCHKDPQLRVRCTVRANRSAVIIVVEDSCAGFDWQTALMKINDELEQRGRGLRILTLYASELAYNQEGNRITIRRDLSKGNNNDGN